MSPPPADPDPQAGALDAWLEEWTWHALIVLFYLPVANGALVYLWWSDGEFAVRARTIGFQPATDAALGIAVGLVLFATWAAFTPWVPWLRGVAEGLGQAIGRPSWLACLVVAVASALGEEMLFRAVIQERLGLAVGVIAFAAAHVPWERRMAPWPLVALGSGLVLGLLYDRTGAVIAPVFAHLVVNLLGLRWIGERYGRVSASASTGSAR